MNNIKNTKEFELNENTLAIVERIADRMPGGFFIYHADEEEELIYFNHAMLRIFGCDTKEEFYELTHNSFRGIVHRKDLERVEESIWEQINNSQTRLDYVEYRITKKDGTVCWVEDYGHFAHTELYGDVFYVFIEDATDRLEKRLKELESLNEELRIAYEKESQYKKAILHNAYAVFEVNLTQDLFVDTASQIVNGQLIDMFEYMKIPPVVKYSDYIRQCASQISEDERTTYQQFLGIDRLIRCFQKGELEQIYEVWTIDSDGRRRLYHYAILLGCQENTGDISALFVCTDITEKIERQNLLQIAFRQAQSASIARSAFLMNMSHDLRTPLNAIIGYADLLLNYADDPKILDYVKKIKQAGDQLLPIIKEAMDVTWAESGKAVLVESVCNIDQMMREIVSEFQTMVSKRSLHLNVDCENIRHRNICADTIRLKEIVSQLLDNAVKYSKPGGQIGLTIHEEPNAPEGYGQFVLRVQDNGIGIPDEFRKNLFQAFSREKNTTMSKVVGSGLGLAVVKTYVDMMEGSIQVNSKVGEGSTFTVKILFRLAGDAQAADKEPEPVRALDCSELIGKRILLVEDNAFNAEIAQALLEQSGFVIETAANGQIGLDMVKNAPHGHYCAVLMDIQMPVMDGYEATRRIRQLEDSEQANIPIIALSANAFPEDQQRAIESGMDAHFPKPIDIKGLLDLLCRVLAKVL